MSANILLISVAMLKERTTVHGNMDEKLVYPDIKYAQDAFIKPILGTALYDKLQALVKASEIGLSGNEDYKNLLDEYLVDTLVYYTLASLPMSSSFQFWNKGVIRKHGQDTELPSMSDLVDIANNYKSRAEYYANRMKLFLLDQTSRLQKYPEYTQPGNTIDTITPQQRQFTMPIYLGDDGDNPWCNEMGFNGQPYKP